MDEYDEKDYEEWGGREGYLESLALDYGVDYFTVSMMADMLGPNEDFDGLVCELEDLDYNNF